MATVQEYIATAEFHLNMDGGKLSVTVRKGDTVLFDGMNAEYKGQRGTAPSLNSVVGNWMQEKGTKITSASNHPGNNQSIKKSTGVADVTKDTVLAKAIDAEIKTPVTKKVVVNSDDFEVRRVSKEAFSKSTEKNTSGVEMEKETYIKQPVVHEDQRIAKETGKTAAIKPTEAKRAVLTSSESEGVVVKKVSAGPAKTKTEVTERTVISEDVVVKATDYEESSPTDIGSSTQTKTSSTEPSQDAGAIAVGSVSELSKGLDKADSAVQKKRIVEHSDPSSVTAGKVKEMLDDQSPRIIKKTNYDKSFTKTSMEGIETTLFVGNPEEVSAKATTSNSDTGIIGVKAVVSKMASSESSGLQQDAEVVRKVRTSSDISSKPEEDIDITQLLNEVSTEEVSTSVLTEDGAEATIEGYTYEGVSWKNLHWKIKVQLIYTLKNKTILEQIINEDYPKPLKTAAEKRLNELG